MAQYQINTKFRTVINLRRQKTANFFRVKLPILSYLTAYSYALDAQNNRIVEAVLLEDKVLDEK